MSASPVSASPVSGGAELVGREPPPPRVPRDYGSLHDATMVLPAFLTGKIDIEDLPEPKADPSGRPDPNEKLSATERGMLLFVAALLGIGTIAVVAVMGMGLTTDRPKATPPKPQAASVAATTSPTPSPSPSPSATPSPAATTKPPATKAAPRLLGSINGPGTLNDFCSKTWQDGATAYFATTGGWTCTANHHTTSTVIAPNGVCRWQYGDKTAYTAAVGTDQLPWKCYT